MFGISMAGGAEFFAAFIVLMLFAFVQSHSPSGSSIGRHPYFRRTTDCPGARSQRASGRDGIARMSGRGTR